MERCRAVTVSGKYKANKDHAGWVRMGLFHLLRGVLSCKKNYFCIFSSHARALAFD